MVQLVESEMECTKLSDLIKVQREQLLKSTDQSKSLEMQLDAEKRNHNQVLHQKKCVESELTEQMNWYLTLLEEEQLFHKNEISTITKVHEDKFSLTSKRLEVSLKDISDLNDKLSKLKTSLVEKAQSFDEAQLSFKEKEAHLTSEMKAKDSVIESLISEKEETEKVLTATKMQITEEQDLVSALNDKVVAAENLCNEAHERISCLESKAKLNSKLIQLIRVELVKTSESLDLTQIVKDDEEDSILEQLVEFVRSIRDHSKDLKSNAVAGFELANSRERAVSRLERTLNSKERDIDSLHVQVCKFKTIVSDLKIQLKEGKERNVELEKEVNDLKNDLADLEGDAYESEDIVAELLEQKLLLESEMKCQRGELEDNKTIMHRLETQIKEYEVKLMILEDALAKSKANSKESSKQAESISSLQCDLEAVSCEVESLVLQNDSHESEISALTNKLKESEHKEEEAMMKVAELETAIQQQSSMFQTLELENESLFEDNEKLRIEIDTDKKSISKLTKNLNEAVANLSNEKADARSRIQKIEVLKNALRAAKSEIKEISRSAAKEKEAFQKENKALVDTCQEVQGRLSGTERLAKIHDKECVRLLNLIESKGEEINSLKLEIGEFVTLKKELESTIEQQRKDIVSLESSLETIKTSAQSSEENFAQSSEEREELQTRLDSLTIDLEEREKKIAEIERKLTEATNQNSSYLLELQKIRKELSSSEEALLQQGEQLKNELKSKDENADTCSTSNDLAALSDFSPSTTDIVTKHSELLDDLVKMKTIIRDAITPVKEEVKKESMTLDSEEGGIASQLQKELHIKNKVLSTMEEQIDYLLRDISMAKKALTEKDDTLNNLENEKYHLIMKLKNIQAYLQQVEKSLCVELQRRRKVEHELKVLKKENKSLAKECELKNEALGEAKNALAKKSRDVDEREDMARQLANQLQTTKNKIIALKAHLKREGLLQETPKTKRRQS